EAAVDCELVVGLESLVSPQELAAIQDICEGRAIFSLDMRSGMPLARIESWKSLAPDSIAGEVISSGIERLILLDLADVGVEGGTRTIELCRQLRKVYPFVQLVAGGGVR